jgi:hypothetical protein
MPRSHPIQYSLTAGELSPRLEGRVDLAKYYAGVKTAENVLLLPHGGATRRPGTRYLGALKTSATKARLIPFEFSATQVYMLEVGVGYIRLWQNGALVEVSPGVPVELATGYGDWTLVGLQAVQSADVLFLVHQDQPPYQLERYSQTVWKFRLVPFNPPPSYEYGQRTTTTLTPSATSGAITLTASAAQFEAADVGREVVVTGGTSVGARATITGYTSTTQVNATVTQAFVNTSATAAASWYLTSSPKTSCRPNASGGATSTTLTPSATSGAAITLTAGAAQFVEGDVGREVLVIAGANVGARAVITAWTSTTVVTAKTLQDFVNTGANAAGDWALASPDLPAVGASLSLLLGATGWRTGDVGKYVHLNGGVAEITAITSASLAQATLRSELATTSAAPSGAWSLEEAAWSAANGYPQAVDFFEDRLWFAGTAAQPNALWASASGDYLNFATGFNDDAALEFHLNSRQNNRLQWLASTRTMLAGTLGEEWLVTGGDGPLTPSTIQTKSQTTYGSGSVPPLRIGNVTLMLQRAGRKLRELVYDFNSDGYVAPDLTLLAEHITQGGIVALAYQQEPDSVVWAVRADGVLLSMTYKRDQDVVGWCRHPTRAGDEWESVAVLPHPDGDREQVWVIVKRSINGAPVRYVEVLDDGAYLFDWGPLWTDCALSYNGVAATTISGLTHLNGETVAIVGDGAVYPEQTVSGGQVTISPAASVVEIGLPYTSTIETMRPEVQSQTGTAQGRLKRWSEVLVRLESTVGVRLNGQQYPFRTSAMNMDAGVEPFSGDVRVSELGWDREGHILVEQTQPLPLTVLAISGTLVTGD